LGADRHFHAPCASNRPQNLQRLVPSPKLCTTINLNGRGLLLIVGFRLPYSYQHTERVRVGSCSWNEHVLFHLFHDSSSRRVLCVYRCVSWLLCHAMASVAALPRVVSRPFNLGMLRGRRFCHGRETEPSTDSRTVKSQHHTRFGLSRCAGLSTQNSVGSDGKSCVIPSQETENIHRFSLEEHLMTVCLAFHRT
jgi:hypothetical protein